VENCPRSTGAQDAARRRAAAKARAAAQAAGLSPSQQDAAESLMSETMYGQLRQQGANAWSDLFSKWLGPVLNAAAAGAGKSRTDLPVFSPLASILSPPTGGGGTVYPGSGGFFDPLRGPPGREFATNVSQITTEGTVPVGLAAGVRPEPDLNPNLAPWESGGGQAPFARDSLYAGSGQPVDQLPQVTDAELSKFFARADGCDDSEFVIEHWVGRGVDPLTIIDQLSRAKKLHRSIVVPVARYYKALLWGDPDAAVCVTDVRYSIASPEFIRRRIRGGPTSRHRVGEAVIFGVQGVTPDAVCQDIAEGRIPVSVGAFGASSGVYATLPFEIDGYTVSGLRVFQDTGVPGSIGYEFTGR